MMNNGAGNDNQEQKGLLNWLKNFFTRVIDWFKQFVPKEPDTSQPQERVLGQQESFTERQPPPPATVAAKKERPKVEEPEAKLNSPTKPKMVANRKKRSPKPFRGSGS